MLSFGDVFSLKSGGGGGGGVVLLTIVKTGRLSRPNYIFNTVLFSSVFLQGSQYVQGFTSV